MGEMLSIELDDKIVITSEDELSIELNNQIQVKRFNSISEIDRACWDSSIDNLFQSYEFLKCIETAEIEHSKLFYLIFYANEKIIGSAVLSSFDISLDLLAGYSFQKFVKAVRKYIPSFFRVKFLFCGTPISIGKNNICLNEKSYEHDFTKLLSREMAAIAKETGSKIQCVKELSVNEVVEFKGLCRQRFLLANTIPYMRLDIRWSDFESYIKDMRYSFRRQVKEGLKKLGLEEPTVYKKDSIKPDQPYLLLTAGGESSAAIFYKLYLVLMERQKNKLETLNKKFFDKLFNNIHTKAEIISLVHKDEVLGAALLIQVKDKMTFLLIGFDCRKNKTYDTYFNIVYAIISLAIQRRCKILEMGQTSYYFKQRCGALPTDIYMYIKSDNKLIHLLLKTFRKFLFPKIKLPVYNVFRNN